MAQKKTITIFSLHTYLLIFLKTQQLVSELLVLRAYGDHEEKKKIIEGNQ